MSNELLMMDNEELKERIEQLSTELDEAIEEAESRGFENLREFKETL